MRTNSDYIHPHNHNFLSAFLHTQPSIYLSIFFYTLQINTFCVGFYLLFSFSKCLPIYLAIHFETIFTYSMFITISQLIWAWNFLYVSFLSHIYNVYTFSICVLSSVSLLCIICINLPYLFFCQFTNSAIFTLRLTNSFHKNVLIKLSKNYFCFCLSFWHTFYINKLGDNIKNFQLLSILMENLQNLLFIPVQYLLIFSSI